MTDKTVFKIGPCSIKHILLYILPKFGIFGEPSIAALRLVQGEELHKNRP
jgi:hypothetical protein